MTAKAAKLDGNSLKREKVLEKIKLHAAIIKGFVVSHPKRRRQIMLRIMPLKGKIKVI